MEFITNLNRQEFDSFCLNSKLNHYTKTSLFGAFKEKEGFKYHLVGVKDNDKLIATALLQIKSIPYLASNFAYVSYGYNLDFSNLALFSFFNQNLVNYAKSLNACFLRIDPNIPRIEHTKDGKIKEDGFNHEFVTDLLKKDGFIHLGYNYGYSGNWLSRYTYELNLEEDLSKIQKNIKRFSIYTKKNQMRDLSVVETGKEGLEVLYQGELALASSLKFKPKPLTYFNDLYDAFYPHVRVFVAQSNLSVAYQNLVNEIDQLQKQAETAKESKQKEINASIESLIKEKNEMEKEGFPNKGLTPLGAKLIIQLNKHVFNVNMYTFKILPNFRVAFALHSKAIEECKKADAYYYNFEGISGSLDPKDQYYGMFDFKRSFGGDFIEYLGEFDYPISPLKYKSYRKIDPFKRRVQRKLYTMFGKEK